MTDSCPHPLSRQLLQLILDDRTSDRFVCELIWQRLGYAPADGLEDGPAPWRATAATPSDWALAYPLAPALIAAAHKQLLKQQLGFAGYRIGELFPRRTRRATAVNWLLADLAQRSEPLPESGPLPPLLDPPADPATGHPIDRSC
jgi:hypothetical protein